MSGHTPGPWRVELDDRGHVVSVRASGIAPGAVEAKVLRDNSFMLPSSSRAHANARLIAAAPELLAACEQVVREVECRCRDYPRSPAGSCPACVCRAVIAKAAS